MNITSVKSEHKCLACGSELSGPLFRLPNMPAGAQSMPDEAELSADRGVDLPLCRCESCGLVQFDCEPVEYYRDAIRVVGLSETMKELRRADYRLVIDRYGKGRGSRWLECGCSNGDFLAVLAEFDVDIYGTEHGECEYQEARQRLCEEGRVPEAHIMQLFPDSEELAIPGAPFDVFCSFNFLEHQPDPQSMLKCLYRNLADDGIGIISVPSFEYIIVEGRYYELIRDHIANYDMYSISRLCESCGFRVLESSYIGIGDTIRLIVAKGSADGAAENGVPAAEMLSQAYSESAQVCSASADTAVPGKSSAAPADRDAETASVSRNNKIPPMNISALKSDYERMSSEIAGYMGDLERKGRSAALWGAGHQGFTIASTTALKEHIKYIIDSSPRKQGRYAPASHIAIVSPDEYLKDPVDVIIIAAPGYVKEIEQNIRDRYSHTEVGVPAICSILDLTEH